MIDDSRIMEVPPMWPAAPGEEVEVWLESACDHFGGCEHCKGMSTTKELGIETGDPTEDLPVLCNHWCHQKATRA